MTFVIFNTPQQSDFFHDIFALLSKHTIFLTIFGIVLLANIILELVCHKPMSKLEKFLLLARGFELSRNILFLIILWFIACYILSKEAWGIYSVILITIAGYIGINKLPDIMLVLYLSCRDIISLMCCGLKYIFNCSKKQKVYDFKELPMFSKEIRCIFLDGTWGCGKTFYYENTLKTYWTKKYCCTPIYISCFSAQKVDFINTIIKQSNIFYDLLGLNNLISKFLIHSWHNFMPKNKVIVFDDLERLHIDKEGNNYIDIIAIIEYLKIKCNCMILLIGDRLEIEDDVFNKYNEKVVDKHIGTPFKNSIDNLFNKLFVRLGEQDVAIGKMFKNLLSMNKSINLRVLENSLNLFFNKILPDLRSSNINKDIMDILEKDKTNYMIKVFAYTVYNEWRYQMVIRYIFFIDGKKFYDIINQFRTYDETKRTDLIASIDGCLKSLNLTEVVNKIELYHRLEPLAIKYQTYDSESFLNELETMGFNFCNKNNLLKLILNFFKIAEIDDIREDCLVEKKGYYSNIFSEKLLVKDVAKQLKANSSNVFPVDKIVMQKIIDQTKAKIKDNLVNVEELISKLSLFDENDPSSNDLYINNILILIKLFESLKDNDVANGLVLSRIIEDLKNKVPGRDKLKNYGNKGVRLYEFWTIFILLNNPDEQTLGNIYECLDKYDEVQYQPES